MKKIILTVAAVFAFGFANAQDKKESNEGFAKGDVFVTGSVGFGSTKTGDTKSNSFNFSPKVGFFVTENIAVGAELGFGTAKSDNGANGTTTTFVETKTNNFNGGVFGRYYFAPAAKFSPFANLGLGFGSNKTTIDSKLGSTSTSSERKSKTMSVGLGLGFNYFVASNWALEASWAGLTYDTDDNGGKGADKTNTFGLNANLASINLGVLYKF
jgi:opacity protein-like surface antigen